MARLCRLILAPTVLCRVCTALSDPISIRCRSACARATPAVRLRRLRAHTHRQTYRHTHEAREFALRCVCSALFRSAFRSVGGARRRRRASNCSLTPRRPARPPARPPMSPSSRDLPHCAVTRQRLRAQARSSGQCICCRLPPRPRPLPVRHSRLGSPRLAVSYNTTGHDTLCRFSSPLSSSSRSLPFRSVPSSARIYITCSNRCSTRRVRRLVVVRSVTSLYCTVRVLVFTSQITPHE